MTKERPILFSGAMVRAILAGEKTQTRRVVKGGNEMFDFLGGDGDNAAKTDGITLRYARWKDDDGDLHAPEWIIQSAEYPEEGCAPIGQGYGQPGDRLWVREAWNVTSISQLAPGERIGKSAEDCARDNNDFACSCSAGVVYRADGEVSHPEFGPAVWRSPIFMPRWASRITLEITGVRVERLQDISEADAKAEGTRPDEVRQMWLFGASNSERDEIYRRAAVRPYHALWEFINGKTAPWASNPWVWVIEFKTL